MTIGFARRVSTYKRADLLFSNLDRLRYIARALDLLRPRRWRSVGYAGQTSEVVCPAFLCRHLLSPNKSQT